MTRFGLVIGNSEYEHFDSLPGAREDAVDLFRLLTEQPTGIFEEARSLLRVNVPRDAWDDLLDDFFGSATSSDQLLFYFCGHGHVIGKQLFLLMTDTRSTSYSRWAVCVEDLLPYLTERQLDNYIIVLDCCRSGTMLDAPAMRFRSAISELELHGFPGRGRVLVASALPWELATESPEFGHGLFTHYFIQGMRTGEAVSQGLRYIGIYDLVTYVQRQIRVYHPAVPQTPSISGLGLREHLAISQNPNYKQTGAGGAGQESESNLIAAIDTSHGATDLLNAIDRLETTLLESNEPELRTTLSKLLTLQERFANSHPESGLIELSEAMRTAIEKSTDPGMRRQYARTVTTGCTLLAQYYERRAQPEYQAGANLEAARLLAGIDTPLVRDHVSAALALGTEPDSRHSLTAGRPKQPTNIAQFVITAPGNRFLRTLLFLGRNIPSTYQGLEAVRLLLDAGIGPHRLEVARYLGSISSQLRREGNVHRGCLICTGTAVEVLTASGRLPVDPAFSFALNWIEDQRRHEWRHGRQIRSTDVPPFGYNYPASAMKALFVAGRRSIAHEISSLLESDVNENADGTLHWSGVDVEDYVATGKVLEAMEFCGTLRAAMRDAACDFVRPNVLAFEPQWPLREYDSWGAIGYIAAATDPLSSTSILLDTLISGAIWDSDGTWSANGYRTAMFARILMTALSRGWEALV